MGSSKKHKEKDREREHKHKRRHRSRDKHDRERSGSRDRKHKEKEKGKERSGKEKERKADDGRKRKQADASAEFYFQDDVREQAFESSVPPAPIESDPVKNESYNSAENSQGPSGGSGLSLSIEETNKLRAKLGLKPLDAGPDMKPGVDGTKKDEDVHAPPVNMAEVRRTEELREKMSQLREKRRMNILLGKVKTLADDDSDDESALAWVTKNRRIVEERKKADEREKMLAEMDQEFGIGSLVDEEFGTKKSYTSKDLKGLRVEHDQETFGEGRNVILTLKDKGVLEEDDDMLINVNMVDDERAAKNIENKKKKPDYQAYDNDEVDEYGMMKPKEVLAKYDEEIHGPRKNLLNSAAAVNTTRFRNCECRNTETRFGNAGSV